MAGDAIAVNGDDVAMMRDTIAVNRHFISELGDDGVVIACDREINDIHDFHCDDRR
jgi:hypothetical protein